MTLIELLMTMTILAVVLGVGVGTFANMNLGARTAQGLVQNTIRSARNWAVANQAPARIRISDDFSELAAEGSHVIGTWHFEKKPVRGAFGLDGQSRGGNIVDDGYQGKALSFRGEQSRARVEIPVDKDASYDLSQGFSIACALRLERPKAGRILTIGNNIVALETSRSGEVRAFFTTLDMDDSDRPVAGGRVSLQSDPGTLRLDRWFTVAVHYDRSQFRMVVDGVEVASIEESAPVWHIDGPLLLSGASSPFQGSIDSLVLSAVGAEDVVELPGDVRFAKGTPREIRFDAGGRLDPEVHRQPLELVLEFEDGATRKVRVNMYGTVE